MPDSDPVALRRRLRAARRAIGAAERDAAAVALDMTLARMGLPRPRSRIAAYQATDGEIDPCHVIRRALALGCLVYVPVITDLRRRRMHFAALPGRGSRRTAQGDVTRWLDLVLVPLVAFDAGGNRLGRGAGFYDRHFAFLRQRRAWRRPLLLGLGWELQRIARLPAGPRDVPLWGVVTERRTYGHATALLRAGPAGRDS